MSKLLAILSLLLRILAAYIDLFLSGWLISLYSVKRDGRTELKRVRHWWSRLFRGIRYLRGKEGRPEPKCAECGKTQEEHELCCPEDVSSFTPAELIVYLRAKKRAKQEQEDVHSDNN